MNKELLLIKDFSVPDIIAAEKDYFIVYKPPLMHSAPQKNNSGGTLLEWCADKYPEVMKIKGRDNGEGGLLHRLDYETHGLMLVARTEDGMESLLLQQKEGNIIKEYSALVMESYTIPPGFPEKDFVLPMDHLYSPWIIKSAFRPYGEGRKAVRPLPSGEKIYATEIIEKSVYKDNIYSFRLKLSGGFRHQIRCHLAWAGFPVLNDRLYGGTPYGNGMLMFRAYSISFVDPSANEKRNYSIDFDLGCFLISAAR